MPMTQEQYEKSLDNPALCEQLPVRDYMDNVMVRTNGALVAGYEIRGITSYFASDEERDRSSDGGDGGCGYSNHGSVALQELAQPICEASR